MDMTDSLAAKSDQLNAVDLVEPRTFTIEKVASGTADQPFNFYLVELPGKPYRPSKGMRRVIARGWGAKNIEATYPGRRLTLFCEPSVKWGGAPVGGIRVSHMSDVGDGFTSPLVENSKVRTTYRVDPLPDLSPVEKLRGEWMTATPERQAEIQIEVERLNKLNKGASA